MIGIPEDTMESVISFFKTIDSYVWQFPDQLPFMVVLLVGTGIFTTFFLGWPQLKRVKHAIDITRGLFDDPKDSGDVTHFQALSAALSATIGIGNIAGTAFAIHYGGPGALFWMWVTAIFGTSLKYAECTLSMKYRIINPDGSASGGPMYYIEQGLGWKWLAVVFAIGATLCSLGTGNAAQANTIADQFLHDLGIPTWITGILIAILVGMVIIGGMRRIGQVASKLTPTMTVIYVIGGLVILISHADRLPDAFRQIFEGAFTPTGAVGGFAGSVFINTLIWGIRRGLFSNEAGQGSAPIAHAAAKTTEPVREGTVAMVGPYVDTIIVCSITGLSIIVTNAWTAVDEFGVAYNGAPLTSHAFATGLTFLNGYGSYVVTASVFLFALSTMITWSYYGDRSLQYLFNNKWVMPYRFFFCGVLFVAAVVKLEVVWRFTDIVLAFMTIPNLIAILALSGITRRITGEYYSRKHVPYKDRIARRE